MLDIVLIGKEIQKVSVNYRFNSNINPNINFMPRRSLENRNTRKIFKSGKSYCITLPVEMIRELKWREKQKVQISKRGDKLIVEDWKE